VILIDGHNWFVHARLIKIHAQKQKCMQIDSVLKIQGLPNAILGRMKEIQLKCYPK